MERIVQLHGEAMNCPRCGLPMQRGQTQLRGGLLGVPLTSISFTELFFTADDVPDEKYEVQKPGMAVEAWMCRKCRFVLVSPDHWVRPPRTKPHGPGPAHGPESGS